MEIKRNLYLSKLIERKGNGLIKVITGIRRCGKSYLLNNLFRKHLLECGVKEEHILSIALDEAINAQYRNPLLLDSYVRTCCKDSNVKYYVILDEIQFVNTLQNPYLSGIKEATIGFVDVLLGLMKLPNADIYVTGSNSKMLSSDIITEFKDRGDEIKINPLTYSEFYSAYEGDKRYAWNEFMTYGGMPAVLSKRSHEDKMKYLSDLIKKTYITDVIERNNLKSEKDTLEELLNYIASAVGSLTNPSRLANTFESEKKLKINHSTVSSYLDCFIDAFIIYKACRYDIKGRKYIGAQQKYFFADMGLRNAHLNFRQQEENHIMENIIYNELRIRGFSVDVGVVECVQKEEDGTKKRKQLEVDFVCNRGNKCYYVQSALTIAESNKREQEINSFKRISDSFTKIIVVKDYIIPWTDENGIYYIGIEEFLLKYIDTM